ncbi:hypothetical protein CGRA01v4_00830 [Colletotrichum graminicola]|nr:hypothetical protein CGRA01v4_00830 [Colletotrichum graminicola]
MGFLSLFYRQRQEDPSPPPMVCFSQIPAAALSRGRQAFARRSRRLSQH